MDNKERDSSMKDLRQKAIDHIELHLKMLLISDGTISAKEFKQARLVGLISMAKELELITVDEYFMYMKKIEF